MIRPFSALSKAVGLACVIAAFWIGVGEEAGCVALGLAGMLVVLVSVAADVPDRRSR